MGVAVKDLTVRQALVSMGYTEGYFGKWVKPVGFHAFGFHEETYTWTHYYKGLDLNGAKPGEWIKGGIEVWESKVLKTDEDNGSPLYQLKSFEAYTSNVSSGSSASEFHVINPYTDAEIMSR